MQVVGHRTTPYTALQIGSVDAKRSRTHNAQLKYFDRIEVEPKRKVVEFQVDSDALVPLGVPDCCRILSVAKKLTLFFLSSDAQAHS